MKIATVVSPPPLLPAPGPIPPREAGTITAAVGTAPLPRQLHTVYPPRQVKARKSFAGGFQFPRREVQSAVPSTRHDDLNERAEGSTWQSSGNAIESLEAQVAQLQQESQSLRPWSRRHRIESLLHLDSPEVYHTHHYHSLPHTDPHMSLEQLEFLRAEHAKRLTEIEAEYARCKKEGPTMWSSAQLPRHSAFPDTSKSQSRPVPTEMRLRYESRFEEYLRKKRGPPVVPGPSTAPALDLEPFLRYIFRKVDKDGTGQIDKVELMQELHQNPELAHLFGFEAEAMDPDYMRKFEQLFQSLGHGNEVSFPQFLSFFSALGRH